MTDDDDSTQSETLQEALWRLVVDEGKTFREAIESGQVPRTFGPVTLNEDAVVSILGRHAADLGLHASGRSESHFRGAKAVFEWGERLWSLVVDREKSFGEAASEYGLSEDFVRACLTEVAERRGIEVDDLESADDLRDWVWEHTKDRKALVAAYDEIVSSLGAPDRFNSSTASIDRVRSALDDAFMSSHEASGYWGSVEQMSGFVASAWYAYQHGIAIEAVHPRCAGGLMWVAFAEIFEEMARAAERDRAGPLAKQFMGIASMFENPTDQERVKIQDVIQILKETNEVLGNEGNADG